ncbi:MAG: hypothetical protein AB7U20_12500 [Planctomycetaceae bacterium]
MIIIFGSGLYGRTDEVPGLGYVATKFGHLWYIPLIPVGSHFVIQQSGNSWHGAPIPLSGKSVLIGWLRAALLVGIIFGGIATLIALFSPNKAGAVEGAIVLAALIVALVLTRRMRFFTSASYRRASQLAETLGFNAEARIILDLAYGQITQQEAEFRLGEIQEDGRDAFAGDERFVTHSDA